MKMGQHARALKGALAGVAAVSCLALSAAPAVAEDITPASVGEGSSLAAATGLSIPAAAVPKPPGPPWSFSVGANTSGLTVKATSGYAHLSGLIRWNGSYRFAASIDGYPFKGGAITAGGEITGANIFQPVPISGITGSLSGPIEIAPNFSITGGAVSWTDEGFAFIGGVELACTTGALTATASALLVDERNFELAAEGLADACTLGRAGRLDGRPFHAEVAAKDGQVSLDAGIAIGELTLFTTRTSSTTTTTSLQNVAGSIVSPDGKSLALSFTGTGRADLRQRYLPTLRLKATVSGGFAFTGTQLAAISVRLSGVSVNGSTLLPPFGLTTRLRDDVTTAFTTG